jgi:hypothetical protein
MMSDDYKVNKSIGKISDVLNQSANIILKKETVHFFNH